MGNSFSLTHQFSLLIERLSYCSIFMKQTSVTVSSQRPGLGRWTCYQLQDSTLDQILQHISTSFINIININSSSAAAAAAALQQNVNVLQKSNTVMKNATGWAQIIIPRYWQKLLAYRWIEWLCRENVSKGVIHICLDVSWYSLYILLSPQKKGGYVIISVCMSICSSARLSIVNQLQMNYVEYFGEWGMAKCIIKLVN